MLYGFSYGLAFVSAGRNRLAKIKNKVDNIIKTATSDNKLITSCHTSVQEVVQTCSLSDHYVQIATLQYFTVKSVPRAYYIRSFRHCDWDQLYSVLSSAPWHAMSIFDDIDDQWCVFHHLLQECLSSFLPLRSVFSKRSKRPIPWFTPEIADKIKAKNKAKHLFERTQLESDKAWYKNLKTTLN